MNAFAQRFDRPRLAKPLRFGLYGGVGCLAAALLPGELLQELVSPDRFTPARLIAPLLVIKSAMWAAAMAVGVALALIAGQNRYLRRSALSLEDAVRGGFGGAAAGAVSGGFGQLLFGATTPGTSVVAQELLRLVCWTIFGTLLGLGMSFFVKNLRRGLAAAGGAIGGSIGGIFFIAAAFVFGSVIGRLLGAFSLGFGIGMMVALVEAAFRRAWLEVHYGPREIITVNLGPEPIQVGGDGKACTIWARGAPPVAMRFWVRRGNVICEDVEAGFTDEVVDGARRKIGKLEVVVRAGAAERKASGPRVHRPAIDDPPDRAHIDPEIKRESLPPTLHAEEGPGPSPPVGRAKQAPPPPMPKTKQAPPPPVPPAKLTPPPPPPAQASPPPREPEKSQPAGSGEACPNCGRRIPGRPGQYYCIVCDHSF